MTQCEIPKESLGFLLNDATRLIRRRFEARAAELGLTSAQWRLLVHLMRNGPMPQARLADLLEIEPISVSRLVDRMQEAGWVTRCPDPNDRRIRIVEVTPKTIETVAQAKSIADDIYTRAFVGMDPGAHDILLDLLRQVIANLSAPSACEADHVR